MVHVLQTNYCTISDLNVLRTWEDLGKSRTLHKSSNRSSNRSFLRSFLVKFLFFLISPFILIFPFPDFPHFPFLKSLSLLLSGKWGHPIFSGNSENFLGPMVPSSDIFSTPNWYWIYRSVYYKLMCTVLNVNSTF